MSEFIECHSGYAYAERPVALTWEGQRMKIVEILAQWRTPNQKCFKVRTSAGQEFKLSYREATDEWQIQPI